MYASWPHFGPGCTADTVSGAPGYDASGRKDAGAIQVMLDVGATGMRTSRLFTAKSLGFSDQAGARFGAAVEITAANGDEYADVAVGAPGCHRGWGGWGRGRLRDSTVPRVAWARGRRR